MFAAFVAMLVGAFLLWRSAINDKCDITIGLGQDRPKSPEKPMPIATTLEAPSSNSGNQLATHAAATPSAELPKKDAGWAAARAISNGLGNVWIEFKQICPGLAFSAFGMYILGMAIAHPLDVDAHFTNTNSPGAVSRSTVTGLQEQGTLKNVVVKYSGITSPATPLYERLMRVDDRFQQLRALAKADTTPKPDASPNDAVDRTSIAQSVADVAEITRDLIRVDFVDWLKIETQVSAKSDEIEGTDKDRAAAIRKQLALARREYCEFLASDRQGAADYNSATGLTRFGQHQHPENIRVNFSRLNELLQPKP